MISLFSNSAFATDPDISVNDTGTGMCVYDVLDTYSGTAGFKANWEANNIKLRWYNGNTQLDVQSNANDCDYNGGLNVPSTPPTRTGYTFSGWTKHSEMDFSTIRTDQTGTEARGKTTNVNMCTYRLADGTNSARMECSSRPELGFGELLQNEWWLQFPHGTVYGMAKCSVTSASDEIPADTFGENCWCKATGYKPASSDTLYRPSNALPWVLVYNDTVGNCAAYCSYRCWWRFQQYASTSYRQKLFGVNQ